MEIFTKWVPNIFRERVTPATAEAAVAKSLQALQVCCCRLDRVTCTKRGAIAAACEAREMLCSTFRRLVVVLHAVRSTSVLLTRFYLP